MKKCIDCGKWGLLFPLDNNGRCRDCAEAYRKKLQENKLLSKAKSDHDRLVQAYQSAPDLTDIMYNSTYDTLHEDYDNCKHVLQLLSEIDFNKYFSAVFSSVLVPSKHSILYKDHPVFGFCISDWKTKSYVPDKMSAIERSMNESISYLNSAIPKTAAFIEALSAIKDTPVSIDAAALAIAPTDKPEYACSSVTAKTKIDSVKDYIVIDVETTGLDPETDEIIQIAAIRFSDFVPVDSWITFVKPTRSIPPEAAQINGITDDVVMNAPSIHAVLSSLADFIGKGTPLVGHNLPFDLHFLHNAGAGKMLQGRRRYDTLALSQKTYSSAKYTLEFLTRLKLQVVRPVTHNAKTDCLATGLLFEDICKISIK